MPSISMGSGHLQVRVMQAASRDARCITNGGRQGSGHGRRASTPWTGPRSRAARSGVAERRVRRLGAQGIPSARSTRPPGRPPARSRRATRPGRGRRRCSPTSPADVGSAVTETWQDGNGPQWLVPGCAAEGFLPWGGRAAGADGVGGVAHGLFHPPRVLGSRAVIRAWQEAHRPRPRAGWSGSWPRVISSRRVSGQWSATVAGCRHGRLVWAGQSRRSQRHTGSLASTAGRKRERWRPV